MGFQRVGVCHEMGRLDGKWVDTLMLEKLPAVYGERESN